MNIPLFEKLFNEELISPASLEKVKAAESRKQFSVFWELKTILYLGVLLLSGGLGILVYKNIDTIGHQAVLFAIAFLCLGSFYYSYLRRQPFSWQKMNNPQPFADYTVLLGCLLAITFIAYLQAQYEVFGTRYGLASFFPMVLLFFSAYYFDHLGVLSLAITNFAAWMGVTITPYRIFSQNDFSSSRLIYTGLLLGAILIAAAFISQFKNLKKHFAFTYNNFGIHIVFISILAAMMEFDGGSFLWMLALAGFSVFVYYEGLRSRSFYFMLIMVLYAYVGLSYIVLERLLGNSGSETFFLAMMYFIISALGLVLILIRLNRMLRHDAK